MFPFYYSMLSREAQKVYDTVFDALADEKNDIAVDLSRLQDGDVSMIINAIFDDYPEFYTDGIWSCEYSDSRLVFKTPIISICKNKEDMAFLLRFIQDVQRKCFTEYEKVKYVHDFVINSIKFDHDEIAQRAFQQRNHHAFGALYTGQSVCEGIARLTQLLLRMCGVQAIYCGGRTVEKKDEDNEERNGHAWTVVCINDKYYHLDVSHDVCLTKVKNQKSYCYFNLTHDDIIKDHELDYEPEFRKLTCNSVQHNYFHYNNCFFSSLDKLSIALDNTLRHAICNRSPSRYFQFKISDTLKKEFDISWFKMCLSTIYQSIDDIEAKNSHVGIGFDAPSYNDEQGVFSINFTFAY